MKTFTTILFWAFGILIGALLLQGFHWLISVFTGWGLYTLSKYICFVIIVDAFIRILDSI